MDPSTKTPSPVKRCAYGLCNSDSRYPLRIAGVCFIPFPKPPKRSREKCLRWIKACGRPHDQLNVNTIAHETYVCSKHFYDEAGPTEEYPDPLPVDGSTPFKSRKKRKITTEKVDASATIDEVNVSLLENSILPVPASKGSTCTTSTQCESVVTSSNSTQTEETVYSTLDMMAYMSVCQQLEEENKKLKTELEKLKTSKEPSEKFKPDTVNTSNIKNLFRYYTGFPFTTFLVLFTFLFPTDVNPVHYTEKRKDIKSLSLHSQLFLVLCRLRNGFHLKDIAYRFSVSVQSASVIFNSVLHHMYLKLGYLSFWPHRSTIITQMPAEFKRIFPTSIAIIDCTEIKTQRPSAFDSQSQCYSQYKSNTTLKGLVAIDPRGSVMFVSMLFSGSNSDNEICKESGFYTLLGQLKANGYIHDGDSIMADKGFHITPELLELNLNLNSPPLASSVAQMTAGDVAETRKIAHHRLHVERAINRIKNFKLVGRRIPVSLFHMINEIWFVCAMLTNFLPILVKK